MYHFYSKLSTLFTSAWHWVYADQYTVSEKMSSKSILNHKCFHSYFQWQGTWHCGRPTRSWPRGSWQRRWYSPWRKSVGPPPGVEPLHLRPADPWWPPTHSPAPRTSSGQPAQWDDWTTCMEWGLEVSTIIGGRENVLLPGGTQDKHLKMWTLPV